MPDQIFFIKPLDLVDGAQNVHLDAFYLLSVQHIEAPLLVGRMLVSP